MTKKDDEFYDRADSYIHLANKQVSDDIAMSTVSASFMYGMSRYAAFISALKCGDKKEMVANKEGHTEYFLDEFKKAFVENYDDYIENYSKYIKN